jgi:hypothetical protein
MRRFGYLTEEGAAPASDAGAIVKLFGDER